MLKNDKLRHISIYVKLMKCSASSKFDVSFEHHWCKCTKTFKFGSWMITSKPRCITCYVYLFTFIRELFTPIGASPAVGESHRFWQMHGAEGRSSFFMPTSVTVRDLHFLPKDPRLSLRNIKRSTILFIKWLL